MTETFGVHKAVYNALLASDVVGDRVYDEIPESGETVFPYIHIGESDATPDDVTCQNGVDEAMTLQIWSRYSGWAEVKNIIDALRPFLHQVTLVVPGRSSVNVWYDFTRTIKDPNGVDRRGIIQLRILHHE